jgi:hypothetical protein
VPDLVLTVPSETLYNLGPTEVHTIAVFFYIHGLTVNHFKKTEVCCFLYLNFNGRKEQK